MASNPYEKAWSLIQKALKEDEEAMDTSSPVDGVQSDAQPFQTNTSKLVPQKPFFFLYHLHCVLLFFILPKK